GRVVVSTYPERAKAVNVRRDARASLLSLGERFSDPWGPVDGEAEVIDRPDSVQPLVHYYRSISGEPPVWDEYRAALVAQGQALVRLTIPRWGPVAPGGFPARLADA